MEMGIPLPVDYRKINSKQKEKFKTTKSQK